MRIIGLVERRGFRVVGIVMDEAGPTAAMTLDIQPRDRSRRTEILLPQIRRIHGVTAVHTIPVPQASAA
nr:ACT domain-containing protein [Sphingomonas jejuensis]